MHSSLGGDMLTCRSTAAEDTGRDRQSNDWKCLHRCEMHLECIHQAKRDTVTVKKVYGHKGKMSKVVKFSTHSDLQQHFRYSAEHGEARGNTSFRRGQPFRRATTSAWNSKRNVIRSCIVSSTHMFQFRRYLTGICA